MLTASGYDISLEYNRDTVRKDVDFKDYSYSERSVLADGRPVTQVEKIPILLILLLVEDTHLLLLFRKDLKMELNSTLVIQIWNKEMLLL